MTVSTVDFMDVHRADGELVGRLRPDGDHLWQPCTVFGTPIGPVTSRQDAEELLRSVGMRYLAERWTLTHDDDSISVQIVEARPTSVTIRFVDYAHPDLYGQLRVLPTPVGDVLRLG